MTLTDRLSQVMNTEVEMHSFQDGATLGVILALSIYWPLGLSVVAGVLGLNGAIGPKKIIKRADTLVREEDIADAPEYFVLGFILGAIGGAGILVGAKAISILPMM